VIFLLNNTSPASRISGLVLLIVVAILDWFDGYVARTFNISSKTGALMDTLGDRITENLLLVFFAYKGLVPLAVALIFVARSFASDFIRYLSYKNGVGTFAINKSKLGIFFVSSRPSRVIYLVFKITIFALASLALVLELIVKGANVYFIGLQNFIFYGSIVLVVFNLLRFVLLVYDSRAVLKEVFTNAS